MKEDQIEIAEARALKDYESGKISDDIIDNTDFTQNVDKFINGSILDNRVRTGRQPEK